MTEEKPQTKPEEKTTEQKPKPESKETPNQEKKKIKAKPLPAQKESSKQEPQDKKQEEKPKSKKTEPLKKKKYEAIAKGAALPLSKKHCMYICSYIKNKSIDKAIDSLKKVIAMKKPIPFKGEIPHRKGMMSGRYPVKAAGYFVNLLKALKGNALVNRLEIEKTRISIASASWAARPAQRGGSRAKRTNVILKAREFTQTQGEKK